MQRLTLVAFLILGLFLVGCSDDGEQDKDTGPKPDDAAMDKIVADDADNDVSFDVAVVDQGPTPDSPRPDADPGLPSVWKESSVSLSGGLLRVWPISSTSVMAVGKAGLIMKYAGSTWGPMTNPDTTKSTIRGIYEGGSYLFAVGDGGDMYYSGGVWNKGYSSSSYSYTAVWGPKVGSYMFVLDPGSSYPYVRYRSKTSTTSYWSSIYMSSFTGEQFNAIWGSDSSNIWVVGNKGFIMKCGSSTCTSSTYWTKSTSPTTSHLQTVWGSSSTDVFAAGFDGTIIHYDGTTWKKMTTGTSTYFYSVWGSSSSDVWAVGHPIFKSDESIFHYDGTAWKKVSPPHTTYLNDVRGTSATDVWAVGNTHILHYDGSKKP